MLRQKISVALTFFNFDEHVEQTAPLIRVKAEKAGRHSILFHRHC